MDKSCINKNIAVKILSFADMNNVIRDILNENKYTIGDTIYFSGGYYDDDIEAMSWPILNLVGCGENQDEVKQFDAKDIKEIFAFCTSYCIKESSKNEYSNYSLV